MNLFEFDQDLNLLPQDGEVNYFGGILQHSESQVYYKKLLENIAWKHDEVVICGKHITTQRKAAWYGAKKLCLYLFKYH